MNGQPRNWGHPHKFRAGTRIKFQHLTFNLPGPNLSCQGHNRSQGCCRRHSQILGFLRSVPEGKWWMINCSKIHPSNLRLPRRSNSGFWVSKYQPSRYVYKYQPVKKEKEHSFHVCFTLSEQFKNWCIKSNFFFQATWR